ncbi:MAG TPA: acetyl-CoA C-acetyltransferase [Devosia sp.]|jgi:acetyl-CoA C-acetyltransferase|uniref:acetyl-CoA C-acetyltransferase n=1 Tax=Devosia sp. TaxID=1871048 RepID=UPI002DDD5292|nr:acetyl-CoA C-acetyltransferase [Devosia sp.]HEV2513810.1 acetyl-CoA C-acetyltransferase [Devosia sp.]
MSEDAVIVAATRTPIGRFGGAFSDLPATALGAIAIRAVIERSGVDPAAIDDVLIGQVLQAGAGQNPARQSAVGGGIPHAVPAMTINQVCGGGQRTLHLAAQAIRLGDADIVLAGGQDSMTRAPHLLPQSRAGFKMGEVTMQDAMLVDGLVDAFNNVHMGVTAERLARKYQITRDEQDQFALGSQQKAAAAMAAGRFTEEVVPVEVRRKRDSIVVEHDEHPRADTTPEQLAALRPIFDPEGSVTAGNSSGLNDGAAALLVMSARRARQLGLEPLARIASYASAGVDPMEMGLGPVPATRAALDKAGWTAAELDLIELNEAFAAQSLAVNRELSLDPERINVNGGAIALGHPLGGSGARLVVTLLHEMARRNAHKGLATMCIGGGQGVAICLER